MKINYDEDIISRGEMYLTKDKRHKINTIKELVLSRRFDNLYSNYREKAIVIRLALENYILKNNNTKEEEIKKAIDYIKQKIVQGYNKNPFKYTDSILLTDKNIELLFNKEQIEILKITKKKYIDYIYKIAETGPYNKEEKHHLMQFFNKTIDRHNRLQEKYFKKIIESEITPKDEEEQRFFYNFIKVKYNFVNPSIYACKFNDKESESYQYTNYIFINTDEYNKHLYNQIKIICHELRYSQQKFDMESGSITLESLEYIIHELFQRYYNYNYFKTNNSSKIEKEALFDGYQGSQIILERYGKEYLVEKLYQKQKTETSDFEFVFIKDENGIIEPLENFTVKKLNYIIRRNPKELKRYPLLSRLYNKDGNVKTLEELLSKNISTNIENNGELYYFHIIAYLRNTNLEKLENSKKIFINNLEYIQSELNKKIYKMQNPGNLKSYGKEYQKIYDKLYLYYIKIAEKIVNYLCNNIDKANEEEKESIISRISNLIDIIDRQISTDLDNLDIKKALPKYRDRIKNSKYNLYLKINTEKTKKHLDKMFTQEEKKKKITFNGEKYTIEDFVLNVLTHTYDNNSDELLVHMNGIAMELDDYLIQLKDNKEIKQYIYRYPTFNELKVIASKYDFKSTTPTNDNPYGILVVDKNNNPIEDKDLKEKAVIADIWRMAAGTGIIKGEKKPGITIAYEPKNRDRYNYILKLFKTEIKDNSRLDIIKLYPKVKEEKDETTAKIVYELLIHPATALLIEEYLKRNKN